MPVLIMTALDNWSEKVAGIDAVAPEARTGATVIAGARNWSTSVTGSTNAWFETGNWTLASGRVFAPEEQLAGAAVCIVGETVRRELWGGTAGETGLGQQLRVKQFSCDVVGILAAKGQGGMGDQDDAVVLPLHTLQRRVTGSRKVSSLMVSMQDGADSAPLKAALREDADIVLVGEMRDLETISLALTAAAMGMQSMAPSQTPPPAGSIPPRDPAKAYLYVAVFAITVLVGWAIWKFGNFGAP